MAQPNSIINYHYGYTDEGDLDTSFMTERPETSTMIKNTFLLTWSKFVEERDFNGTSNLPPLLVTSAGCTSGFWRDPGDCAKACTDIMHLFENWQSLWTCWTLVSLALTMPLIPADSLARVSIHQALEPLGYDEQRWANGAGFDAAGVLKLTYDCMSASCNDKTWGFCNFLVDHAPTIPSQSSNATEKGNFPKAANDYMQHICGDLLVYGNSDIAGPGVSIRPDSPILSSF